MSEKINIEAMTHQANQARNQVQGWSMFTDFDTCRQLQHRLQLCINRDARSIENFTNEERRLILSAAFAHIDSLLTPVEF